jgi:hypothetical protein
MKASLKVAVLFLFAAVVVTDLAAQPRRGKSRPRVTVVIDASQDGGAWWFPQGPPPFDPKKPHQGGALADHLRNRGWRVIEIPRETRITNQLKGASIVIRMNFYGRYAESEVAAYREYVQRGGRLLLIQAFVREDEAKNDTVAQQFGIRFEGMIETAVMQGAGVSNKDFNETLFRIGSVVVKYPESTQPLAQLADGRLVMGMARYGRGRIIFLSSVFPVLQIAQPFTMRLLDELAKPVFKPKRK